MAYIEIGGPLHSIATGNIVAYTDEIQDRIQNKKQSQINIELSEKLLQCVKTIVKDENQDILYFKDGEGNIIYSLDLSVVGGTVKDITNSNGQITIKYNNGKQDLVLDVFDKNSYYTKTDIDTMQSTTWVISQNSLDALLRETGFLTD